jgi:hypothetical protein
MIIFDIPEDCDTGEKEEEDEFQCLNLVVSMPAPISGDFISMKPLPVLLWIHGMNRIGDIIPRFQTNLIRLRWFTGCHICVSCVGLLRFAFSHSNFS